MVPPRAGYRDVLRAPPSMVAEVIHGQLHMVPRPDPAHAWVASMLGGLLIGRFGFGVAGEPGGWRIFCEVELHLGDEPDIVVPDLAGWRRERMAEVPETPYITGAPDWVCEVLSPATEALDRAEKMDVYLQAGVSHLWLLAPEQQTLEVYQRDEPLELHDQPRRWVRTAMLAGRASVQAEPFAGAVLDLAMLWPR